MNRFLCIHGHFYQPPRENPWLEAIEGQETAHPWHDWNERVTAECYAPNLAARILDGEGRIVRIANNYANMSFNFGPTLLAWMEKREPKLYRTILDADRETRDRFSGHGSALAQGYNHMILPLANRRDKVTQVRWGIRDFEHRFRRKPEGFWLPETAVDLESLDLLAEQGIRFTILSPYQAARTRPIGGSAWEDAADGRVDPTMPYSVALPSGRRIAVFFYDGPVACAVAFERLLSQGEHFAHRLTSCFSDARSRAQIVSIATDGETYGHHHKYGEMALAYALHTIEQKGLAKITNYGEFLEQFPPTHEAEILENTAWSCSHGVERWASHCGCSSGVRPDWSQVWRAPLRSALDALRDRLASGFEERGRLLLKDPWAARDEYIDAILDRSAASVDRYLERHAARALSAEERIAALRLLELQRHAMLMYTSCGWFFDEISSIETVQLLHYAGRAVQLAQQTLAEDPEPAFLRLLERAKSNVPEHRNGRVLYEKLVRPARLELDRVAAHFAVNSLFETYDDEPAIYCYRLAQEEYRLLSAGKARLAIGRARVRSELTGEAGTYTFGVLHLGDHNLNGGVRPSRGEEAYAQVVRELTAAFERGDVSELIRLLDRHFGSEGYSVKLLFRDEQRRVLHQILEGAYADTEVLYRQIYDRHAPMMRFLQSAGILVPASLKTAAGFVLDRAIKRALEAADLDPNRVSSLFDEVAKIGVPLDHVFLSHALGRGVERAVAGFSERPDDPALLRRLAVAVKLCHSLPFEVDLQRAQDACWHALRTAHPRMKARAGTEGGVPRQWVEEFRKLCERLRVRVD